MADHWVENHKRDSWRRQAKSSGYRARSAFKLKQIQEKHTILRPGDVVFDVGCHPGGWSQVALELIGSKGALIGVDLQATQSLEGAQFLTGDIRDQHIQDQILEHLGEKKFNSVISDISPDITGNWDIDQSVALELVAMVFDFSIPHLGKGGCFVTKLFQGTGVEVLIEEIQKHFASVRRFSPEASRNSSSEVYLICKHHTPWKSPTKSMVTRFHDKMNRLLNEEQDEIQTISTTMKVRKKKSS
jgi:23S rRNA (uridine2552-2'-O)-methyltransferase